MSSVKLKYDKVVCALFGSEQTKHLRLNNEREKSIFIYSDCIFLSLQANPTLSQLYIHNIVTISNLHCFIGARQPTAPSMIHCADGETTI